MKSLKIGISGIRGIVGETFTTNLVILFSQAFGTYTEGGRILVSRDTRKSGEMISSAVISGLLSCGCEVIDLGICPTPAMQLFVKKTKAEGGIAITAGHNDERWNALKFIRSDGLFLNHYQAEELLDIFHQGEFLKAKWNNFKKIIKENGAIFYHLSKILENVDIKKIKKKKFKVALDCCNGACSNSAKELLKSLGCEVVVINDEVNRGFPHEPEPKPENMNQLRALVIASKSDIGFALDSDGDRLGIVTEKGEPLPEEYSFCIATKFITEREKKGTVVTSLSTTSAIEEIAKENNCDVQRVKISQAYIAEETLNSKGIIGGEGSGGILFPKINYAYDSQAAMAHILEYLSEKDKKISEIAYTLPKYFILKEKIYCPQEEIYSILQEVRKEVEEDFAKYSLDFQDGVMIRFPDLSWLHIRASITEPLIRIIAEAKSKKRAEELLSIGMRMVEKKR
jgi:phosphomannomutase